MKDFDDALEIDQQHAQSHAGRAHVLIRVNRLKEAYAAAGRSCKYQPIVGLQARGRVLVAAGHYEKGFRDLKEALKLAPHNPGLANMIGWLRSSLNHPDARNPAEAVEYAKKACQLTNYQNWGLIDTLAAAMADAGRWEDAVKIQRKVVHALGGMNPEYQKRLDLYLQRQPNRQPFAELLP